MLHAHASARGALVCRRVARRIAGALGGRPTGYVVCFVRALGAKKMTMSLRATLHDSIRSSVFLSQHFDKGREE